MAKIPTQTCPACGGSGRQTVTQHGKPVETDCRTCGGTGRIHA